MEFLDQENIAGQSLLQLAARGSSIITELLRLSDHVPPVFLGSPGNPQEAQKYAAILMDFRYLKATDAYDEKIDRDPDAVDLDEEFRENHLGLLERFYLLFESMYKYIDNLNSYIEDMNKGSFLQHTMEGVLMDVEGRQLLCEVIYLYGCMLLLLDLRIPGMARERMIVAYYRYKGANVLPNVDDVVRLCRDTGFTVSGKRAANYPEDYFARIPIDKEVIDMVIGKLRTDDIYNHITAFPLPAHRSTALSTQGAMLYVILYFAPHILHSNNAICREVTDKFFVDNWVISMYMGFVVDLTEAWDPYKSARTALKSALTPEVVTSTIQHHASAVTKLNNELDQLLTQGVLVNEYIMDNHRKLLAHTRACNVTLRWLVLHRGSGNIKVKDAVRAACHTSEVLRLLMNTSQFEFIFKTMISTIISEKQARWEKLQNDASELVFELSEVYGGVKALTRVKKNEKLRDWFAQISTEISSVNYGSSVIAGRTLTQLIGALVGVQDNHQVEASLQVMQCIGEVKGMLTDMMRLANITQKVLADLDIIADFSYAKKLVASYTPLIHEKIARDPSLCLFLRATFLKLSSILSLPLVRIVQAGSSDDVSVAEYFSTDLVSYVRSVLEIVPISVFKILDRITVINTDQLKAVPPKVERKDLKDAAQLVVRYGLAKLTNNVSVFTRGILNMQTTLLGIIKLDPQQTLQDGIRKQLVRQVASALNEHLVFPTGKLEDFEMRLNTLGRKLDGFRQSLEYIQDYINTYGLKMWQEEMCRLMNYNVEQERNQFLKKKVYDWQSIYQSDAIPIPVFERSKDPIQGKFVNFTGRVVNELVRQSNPQAFTYCPSNQAWLTPDGKESVNLRTFSLLRQGLSVFGLCGIDKLLSFMIVRDLTAFTKQYSKLMMNRQISTFVLKLSHELHPITQFPASGTKLYTTALEKMEKLWAPLLDNVLKIGQAQLLRKHITNELHFTAKSESPMLYSALTTLNDAVINDLRVHYQDPENFNYPENPMMPELTKYLDVIGVTDPISKIYFTTEPLQSGPVMIFLFVLAILPKFKWNSELSTLVAADKRAQADGAPFVVGVATLLKQLHSAHTHTFLNYLGQYVRAHISASGASTNSSDNGQLPIDVIRVLMFLEEYCKFAKISRKTIDSIVPSYVFDSFQRN